MNEVDLIVNVGHLLVIEPRNTIYKDYALVVNGGSIVDILPQADVKQNYQAQETLDRQDHVVLPGFINAHTHVPMNPLRGIADDKLLQDWLENYIFPTEAACLSEEFVTDGTKLALGEMIRSGTVCFNDMYYFPIKTAEEVKKAGMKALIGCGVMDFETPYAKDADDYLQKAEIFYEKYQGDEQIFTGIAAHAPYTVCEASLIKTQAFAAKYNVPFIIHLQETKAEIETSIKGHGMRPLPYFKKLGFDKVHFVAVHFCNANEEDIQSLKEMNVYVAHCPESNMKLSSGNAPIDEMHEAGITVGLGTDSVASNNDLDMMGEMRTAAFLTKTISGNCEAVCAETALRMATIDAAKVIGQDKTMGSLEKGKSADFIAIDLNQLETQPLYNVTSQLVYAASRNQVTDVWVRGKQLMANRKLLTLDENELMAIAKKWQPKIEKIINKD